MFSYYSCSAINCHHVNFMCSRELFVTQLYPQEAWETGSLTESEAESEAEEEEEGLVPPKQNLEPKTEAEVKEEADAAKVSPRTSLQESIHTHIIYFPPHESFTRSSAYFHTVHTSLPIPLIHSPHEGVSATSQSMVPTECNACNPATLPI